MVRSVGMTTNLEKNRAKIAYSSFKLAQNLIKITSSIRVPNLKENRSTRRLFLRDLKLFLVWCEEEKRRKIRRKSDDF